MLVTHPEEELSSIVASFDSEGVVSAGEDVGGLNLKDICRYAALGVKAHVFVNYRLWQASTRTRGLTRTPAGNQSKKITRFSPSLNEFNQTFKASSLTFRPSARTAPDTGLEDNSDDLRNSSSTSHLPDTHGPFHTR